MPNNVTNTFLHLHDPADAGMLEISVRNPVPVSVINDTQNGQVRGRTQQVVAATTGTLIAPANSARRSILLLNITGAQIVYYGYNSAPSATNGGYIAATVGANVTLYSHEAIYALSAVAGQTLSVTEEEYVGAPS